MEFQVESFGCSPIVSLLLLAVLAVSVLVSIGLDLYRSLSDLDGGDP